MRNTIRITETQFNRLFNTEDLVSEVISPLREILKCRITEDRKHVTYLGRVYDGVTGEELPLTEQALGITKALGTTGKVAASDDGWSLSDIIHTGVDLVSMGADFIVPGSGAIIDIVHALSYIVEAQFSSGEEQDTLYLMAAITGMFAILPGALQAVAPILKRFVKTGGKVAIKKLPMLKTAWDFISKNLSSFLSKLPGWVDKAVNSSIGKKILGGNVDNISKAIADFSTRIKSILNTLKSKTAGLQSTTKKIINKQIDKMSPKVFSKNNQIINMNGGVTNLLTKNGKANSAALSSINRTGGFAKYKDVIVYDLKTGIAYGRNSKEGIKAIANNTKLLSTKGGAKRISKDIPPDWLKYTKDKVRGVKSLGNSTTKSGAKVATKGADSIIGKKLNKILGDGWRKTKLSKISGLSNLPVGAKRVYKFLYNFTPLRRPKMLLQNLELVLKPKVLKDMNKPYWLLFTQIIGNLLWIEIVYSVYTSIICSLGLRNRDDVSKLINFYEDFKWENYDNLTLEKTNQLNGILGIAKFFYNASLKGGDWFWGIIEQDCNEGFMKQYLSYLTPYVDLIPSQEIKNEIGILLDEKDNILNTVEGDREFIDTIINDFDREDVKYSDI